MQEFIDSLISAKRLSTFTIPLFSFADHSLVIRLSNYDTDYLISAQLLFNRTQESWNNCIETGKRNLLISHDFSAISETKLLTYQLPVGQTINSFKTRVPTSRISVVIITSPTFLLNRAFHPTPLDHHDDVMSQLRLSLSRETFPETSQPDHPTETETLWPVFSISRYPFKNRLENPPSNVLQILLPANLDGPQRAVKVRAWILLARRWNYDRSVVQCVLEEQHGDNTACVKFTLAILSVSSSC